MRKALPLVALPWLLLMSHIVSAQEEPQNFTLVEKSMNVEHTSISNTGLWMWWGAVFNNPNPQHYCPYPAVTVTARDSRGNVVGTYDKNMVALMLPNAKIAYGDNLEVLNVPASIEITPVPCNWRRYAEESIPDFKVTNGRVVQVGDAYKVSGEVYNPLSDFVDSLNCAVLFRDEKGRLLGNELLYIKNIPSRATKPFMADLYFQGAWPKNFSAVEIIAFPSSLTMKKL